MKFFKLTHTGNIYRFTRAGNKDQYSATPAYINLDAGIFPAGTDILAMYPGELAFDMYEMYFFELCDLKNGDKYVSGSDEWIIKGVPQKFNSHWSSYIRCIGQKVVGT